MATLEILPCEMLTEILSHLPIADLTQTSLVSRRFNEVSLPLLYKSPSLRHIGPRTHRQSINIFLWTILTPGRETLTNHVHTLRWHWYNQKRVPRRCPSENALLAPAASHFGLRHSPRSAGAKFVLLIHLLPRLRILRITCPVPSSSFTIFMDSRYLAHTLPTANPALPPVLQSLREFHSPTDQTRRGITHKTLVMLLLLPSIRCIDVQIADIATDSIIAMEGVAAVSTVTEMHLGDRNMAPTHLKIILALPIALTYFSYSTVRQRYDFDLDCFWESMRPLRNTVVYLNLDLKLNGPSYPHQEGQVGVVVNWSLREWCALRTLRCPLVALLGNESPEKDAGLVGFLPARIRELEFWEDGNWSYREVFEQVMHLLDHKMVVVPVLETVAVKGAEVGSTVQDRLKDACEAVGVKVVDHVRDPRVSAFGE